MTKILIIEDEVVLRDEVEMWLTFEDYEVVVAADGVEGVAYAFHHLPDLIVCDITMPRLNGHGVLLEMRANPTTAAIPFIFMTARAAYEDVRMGMTLGADDYIIKPFSREEMLQAIQVRLKKNTDREHQRQHDSQQLHRALVQKEQQQLLNAKMIALFSQDFRIPLSTIVSSSHLIRDYASSMDESRRLIYLNRVEASARHLMQMLEDLLVVSQMETGTLDFKPEKLDAGIFFQQMVDEFQAIYGDTRQVTFENRFMEPLVADSRLLQQIGTNLISNAIKASPHGSDIRIFLDKNAGSCILTVQSQSTDLSGEVQPDLPGTDPPLTTANPVHDAPLELAIVRQAVALHGGSIRLERPAAGTKVIVAIPTE